MDSVINMIIEIQCPVFKCADDEYIFFSRLNSLSGCENVIRKGRHLHLRLGRAIDFEGANELQKICDYWGTCYELIGGA